MDSMSRAGVFWLRASAVGTLGFCLAMYFYLGREPIMLPIVGAIAFVIMMTLSMGPVRRRRFLERAIKGQATITGVKTTGIVINNVPVLDYQLQVQGPTGAPYTAHDRVTAYPGGVPSSGTFQCAIDPKRPKKVAVLLDKPIAGRGTDSAAADSGSDIGSAIARAIAQSVGARTVVQSTGSVVIADSAGAGTIADAVRAHVSGMRNVSGAELLATGQRMTALVRQFSPIGKTVGDLRPGEPGGDDPLYLFELEIPLEGGSPIDAVCVHRVPTGKVDGLRLGERLNVAVNPANPAREVAIDWETSPII